MLESSHLLKFLNFFFTIKQPAKASLPIDFTPSCIVMVERDVQPENALPAMAVTSLGMLVLLQPVSSVLVCVSMIALQ